MHQADHWRRMTDCTAVESADLAIAEVAAPFRHTALVKLLGGVSEIADQPPLIATCAATLAIGLLRGDRRLARAGGRMLAAELLATVMKGAIKHRIDRTRPSVVDDGGKYVMQPGSDRASSLNSFPSGHTAGAVAVSRAFVREYPEYRGEAYTGAAAIGIIQIPRCQHYSSDLAAGTMIGLVAEALVDWGVRLTAHQSGRRSHLP